MVEVPSPVLKGAKARVLAVAGGQQGLESEIFELAVNERFYGETAGVVLSADIPPLRQLARI